jgi:hypothetical protein
MEVRHDCEKSDNNGYNAFALARYNLDGNPDYGFGFRGTVITSAGVSEAAAYSVAIQADGKIVAGRG